MAADGYYSHPSLHGDTLAFVCEESAWVVALDAGGGARVPRRVTSVPGGVTALSLSPDGARLALSVAGAGYEELYCCSAGGGAAVRLTHVGARCARVAAWTPDGAALLFACDARAGAAGGTELWWVPSAGGAAAPTGLGPASAAAFRPGGAGRALGRHTRDPATAEWKRYGGGRGGELWVDAAGGGAYECVLDAKRLRAALATPPDAGGSMGAPAWAAGGRIAFAADPGGAAGVYSCAADGSDVRCHVTAAAVGGFYPRHVAADGRRDAAARVAFAAGGRLWLSSLDSAPSSVTEVLIDWRGPRVGRALRFCDAEEELESAALHPEGASLAVVCRGRAFALGLWAGPALAFPPAAEPATADAADADAAGGPAWGRARLACWLFDGARVAFACDASGDDDIEVHTAAGSRADAVAGVALQLPQPALGRPEEIVPSPQAPLLAVVNHRGELLIVDVDARTLRRADVAAHAGGLGECAWSPCGCWLAYSACTGPDTAALRLLDVRTGAVHAASAPLRRDSSPAWDPSGRYLYFISARDFEPHYDEAERVGLGFPHAARPYVATLRADLPNPLLPELRAPGDDDDEDDGGGDDGWEDGGDGDPDEQLPPEPIVIDLEGLVDRAVALPVPVGRYGQVLALERERLMFTVYPVHTPAVGLAGDDGEEDDDEADAGTGSLLRFDLRTLREATLVPAGVDDVTLSMDGRTMAVQYGGARPELRVLRAGEKPREEDDDEQPVDPDRPGPDSGLIDIGGRVRLEVHPAAEWRQMLREAWRRLRDDFWDARMGGVDWPACLRRYQALLPRVACRAELGDVLAEMLAELGCSHAWCSTGDPGSHRGAQRPARLGADCVWDAAEGGYRVTALLRGDAWDARRGGPLAKPGVGVAVGDVLLAIDRVPLTPRRSPDVALVCAAGGEVLLSFRPGAANAMAALRLDAKAKEAAGKKKGGKGGKSKGGAQAAPKPPRVRHVRVKPLADDADARYRDAVARATAQAHTLGGGTVGYVAVPGACLRFC